MTAPSRRLLALGAGLLLVSLVAGVASVPSYAEGSATRAVAGKKAPKAIHKDKRIVVSWKGEKKRRVYQKSANVPGIGTVDLICRPNSTQVRMRPNSRSPETQLWMAKFETKNDQSVAAVKTVRVYTYATAADSGRGGTGTRAGEGLNQQGNIEDFQKGNAYGVISQRPARNREGLGSPTTPITSFTLNWWWERFRHPGKQYCKMALTLHTDTTRQFGLNWHGADEAARRETSTTTIPGLGTAIVTCEPGQRDNQTVAFKPTGNDPEAYLDSWYIQGEGPVLDVVDRDSDLRVDPATGLLGPVELPRNGMMRLWVSVNGVKRGYVLSSYFVVNDDKDPALKLCEVAAAPLR